MARRMRVKVVDVGFWTLIVALIGAAVAIWAAIRLEWLRAAKMTINLSQRSFRVDAARSKLDIRVSGALTRNAAAGAAAEDCYVQRLCLDPPQKHLRSYLNMFFEMPKDGTENFEVLCDGTWAPAGVSSANGPRIPNLREGALGFQVRASWPLTATFRQALQATPADPKVSDDRAALLGAATHAVETMFRISVLAQAGCADPTWYHWIGESAPSMRRNGTLVNYYVRRRAEKTLDRLLALKFGRTGASS